MTNKTKGNNMKATYESKDQNWTDEQTIYWFDVVGDGSFIHGGKFGVVEGQNAGIVDDEGAPIEGMFYEHTIRAALNGAVTDEMRAE